MLSFVWLTAPLAPVNHDVHVIETKETSVNVTVWHALQTNGPIRYESSYKPFFSFQRDEGHAIAR